MSGLKEGAARAVGENRTMGRKVRPSTDVASIALGEEEIAVCL
jgi:hypothetical protein